MDYKPKKTICGRCGEKPRVPGQGYCPDCRREYAAEERKVDRLLLEMMRAALKVNGYDLDAMRRAALAEVRRSAAERAAFEQMPVRAASEPLTGAAVWQ